MDREKVYEKATTFLEKTHPEILFPAGVVRAVVQIVERDIRWDEEEIVNFRWREQTLPKERAIAMIEERRRLTQEAASAYATIKDGKIVLTIDDPHDCGWVAITHTTLQHFVDELNRLKGYGE